MIARLLAILLLATPAATAAREVAPDVLDTLPAADVVILGEVHDNPLHHVHQARAVAALAPRAVVWEMLTPDQAALMPADRTDPQAVAEALDWADGGWPDFAFYHPIVLAAPAARHVGAGVPRDDARRVFAEPLADVFGAGAEDFGLHLPLAPDDQARREAGMAAAHCDVLPEHLLPGMVAAQRLRDATLARAVLEALAETGGPVAVIAGSGHAHIDTGIPAMIRLAAPEVRVLALGQVEGDPGPDAPFNLWIVTPATERAAPCDSLR